MDTVTGFSSELETQWPELEDFTSSISLRIPQCIVMGWKLQYFPWKDFRRKRRDGQEGETT